MPAKSKVAKRITTLVLRNASIYLADGKLARYTGDTRTFELLRITVRGKMFALLKRLAGMKPASEERFLFSAHGKRFYAPISKVAKVDHDGVRAYLGRRPYEAIGGANKTGVCERVRALFAKPRIVASEYGPNQLFSEYHGPTPKL